MIIRLVKHEDATPLEAALVAAIAAPMVFLGLLFWAVYAATWVVTLGRWPVDICLVVDVGNSLCDRRLATITAGPDFGGGA